MANNNVIFIHPDGTAPAHFAAGRLVQEGPDGRLNWDEMTNVGVYLEHIEDRLVSTSNTGAVIHSHGTKAYAGSYGFNEDGTAVESLSYLAGEVDEPGLTIMEEAINAGKATAVINSGFIAEPGTGVFLASAESRRDVTEITKQIVESGVDIIMGGGEKHYLPVGTVGFFGEEGIREDGRNLIEEAAANGYTVVYTREQLQNIPEGTEKLLGIFAAEDTYNDTTEEANIAAGLENYGQPGNENPPTVAEMLEAALPIVSQDEDGFFVVLEEEGTDNFPNNNNSRGTIEAVLRADAAIGVAMDYIENEDPNTLLLTAADSNAGNLQIDDKTGDTVGTVGVNPTLADRSDAVQVPLDGQNGADTEPFVSAPATNPSAEGTTYEFGVSYAGTPDFAGNIVAKAHGMNADQLPATADNTDMYRLMYQTLFGVEPEAVSLITTEEVGGTTVEAIDLTGFDSQPTVMVDYTITREAAFDNEVYFYAVDDINGGVNGVNVGDANYAEEALKRLVSPEFSTADGNTETKTLEFNAGSIVVPVIIADGTFAEALSGAAEVYFPYLGANSDGFDHIRFNDTTKTFEFEDLANGGDQDFNDITITINRVA